MARFVRPDRTTLVAVLGVATLLRLAVVGRQPLWADEIFSLAMATGHSLEHPAAAADPRLGDFVESARPEPPSHYSQYLNQESPPAGLSRVVRAVFLSDTSPPFYYLLLAAWTRLLGASDQALRLFSVASSLVALALIVPLARRAGGRRSVLPAALLFAVSPIAVHYSTEGRMYALLWVWVAALLVLALRIRLRGCRLALLAAYAAVAAAGLLTHYSFAAVWLVASAWLLAHPGRCRRSGVVLTLVLTALLVVPWYAWVPRSLSQWRVTAQWLRMAPEGFHPVLGPLSLPWALLSIRTASGVPPLIDALNGIVLLIVCVVAILRLGRHLLDTRRRLLWLAAGAGVGTPVVVDLALGTYMSAVPRYALAALPPALVLVAVALGAFQPRRRFFVVTLILVLALAGTWRVQRDWARGGEPFAQLSQFVASQARASDVIVVHSIPSGVCGVARYIVRSGALPDGAPLASWVGQLRRRQVPQDIEALTRGRRRVFLVKVHAVGDAFPEETWLRREARLVVARSFGNASALVFEPVADDSFSPSGGRPASLGPTIPRRAPDAPLDR